MRTTPPALVVAAFAAAASSWACGASGDAGDARSDGHTPGVGDPSPIGITVGARGNVVTPQPRPRAAPEAPAPGGCPASAPVACARWCCPAGTTCSESGCEDAREGAACPIDHPVACDGAPACPGGVCAVPDVLGRGPALSVIGPAAAIGHQGAGLPLGGTCPRATAPAVGFPIGDAPVTFEAWVSGPIFEVGYGGAGVGELRLAFVSLGGAFTFTASGPSDPRRCQASFGGVTGGGWHLLTITYDDGAAELYLDGERRAGCRIADHVGGPLGTPADTTLSLGGSPLETPSVCEEGGTVVDDLQIFARALLPAEIAARFAAAEPGVRPDTVTLWRFDELAVRRCCPADSACAPDGGCVGAFGPPTLTCPDGTLVCPHGGCCPTGATCTDTGCRDDRPIPPTPPACPPGTVARQDNAFGYTGMICCPDAPPPAKVYAVGAPWPACGATQWDAVCRIYDAPCSAPYTAGGCCVAEGVKIDCPDGGAGCGNVGVTGCCDAGGACADPDGTPSCGPGPGPIEVVAMTCSGCPPGAICTATGCVAEAVAPTCTRDRPTVCGAGACCPSGASCGEDGSCVFAPVDRNGPQGLACDDGFCDEGEVCTSAGCCPDGYDVVCGASCCPAGTNCDGNQCACEGHVAISGFTEPCGADCCHDTNLCVQARCQVDCATDPTTPHTCGDLCCAEACADSFNGHCACPADAPIPCHAECCGANAACTDDGCRCLPGFDACGALCCGAGQVCVGGARCVDEALAPPGLCIASTTGCTRCTSPGEDPACSGFDICCGQGARAFCTDLTIAACLECRRDGDCQAGARCCR